MTYLSRMKNQSCKGQYVGYFMIAHKETLQLAGTCYYEIRFEFFKTNHMM